MRSKTTPTHVEIDAIFVGLASCGGPELTLFTTPLARTGRGNMSVSATLSFAQDIRPMFTNMDVDHMKKAMDLSDRASVFQHAQAIYESVSSGHMPPTSCGEPRWTPDMCAKFKKWQEQGGQP
jgi:hypothetical protein